MTKHTSKKNKTTKFKKKSRKNSPSKHKSNQDTRQPTDKKTIVKKSLRDATIKKNSLGTPFLVVALSLCALAVGVIVFILLSQFVGKEKLFAPPVPRQLSTIEDEATFLTIKNSLLQNALEPREEINACLGANFFHEPSQKTTYAYDKFIVILKRGKLFVTNSTTNKFVGHTEISPYPVKEENAITYNNIFLNDGIIIVTGYRTKTNSLEISTFPISIYGKVTRGETYSLPSSACNFASRLDNNKLTFYTSRSLTQKVTLKDIKMLSQWSTTLNKFTTTYPEDNTIFYDNSSFLDNPTVHTITTCSIKEHSIANCQQRHLIDSHSAGHYLDKNYFYMWTTELSTNTESKDTIPSAKLHQFDLSNSLIKMIQVEGTPIAKDALSTTNRELFATIYQSNHRPPAWQTDFTKNRMAHFHLNPDEFSATGSFVNSPDNYTLLTTTFNNLFSTSEEILTTSPDLITLNKNTSTINIHTESIKSFSIDGLILSAEKLPNQERILIIHKKNTSILAQIINIDTSTISNALSLQEINGTTPSIAMSFLNVQDQLFASVALTEKSAGRGSLHLLNISTNEISQSDKLAFTKTYQRVTDGCQNDCQQSWQDQVSYFSFSTTPETSKNSFIYATIGSKLRKLIVDTTGAIRLSRTIDYTYRPAPPKPKRPRAKIPGGAKIVNGKYVCGKKKGYVGKSKKNNKGYLHLDLECCLDPDEYPNPWCTYKPGELSVTNLRYKDYTGRKKVKKH